MLLYLIWLVVVAFVWLWVAPPIIMEGIATDDPVLARRAKLVLLSVILVPFYPVALVAAVPVGIVVLFRKIGSNTKKEKE